MTMECSTMSKCRAGTPAGINYGKPHVPVKGLCNGRERYSCLYCGAWLESLNNELGRTVSAS
jgi:hypothetical protein